MKTKNNKGLIGGLIIIIVLLLCVIGYLLFEKEFSHNKIENNTTTTKSNAKKIIKDISELFDNLNNSIIRISDPVQLLPAKLLETDFRDYELTNNNISFTFDCISYGDYHNEGNACLETKVSFNNISYIKSTDFTTCGEDLDILFYKDFIILLDVDGCVSATNFEIYDKAGKFLYSPYGSRYNIYDSNIRYTFSVDNKLYQGFNIIDDILYYAEIENKENVDKLYLKYIDLDNLKFNSNTIGVIDDATFGTKY